MHSPSLWNSHTSSGMLLLRIMLIQRWHCGASPLHLLHGAHIPCAGIAILTGSIQQVVHEPKACDWYLR